MWLQEPRFGCRILRISFQSGFARFCMQLIFFSNSRSFGAALTRDFLLAATLNLSDLFMVGGFLLF